MDYTTKSGIYKITCVKNKKSYIGQSVNVKARLNKHKSNLKSGIHHNDYLQKTYNKYGVEKFIFEIIELCDIEDLDTKETFWISFFDTTNENFGFNFQSGGNFNKITHPKTKEKMRLSSLGSSECLTVENVRHIKMALYLGIQPKELTTIYKVSISTISKINKLKNWDWVLPYLNENIEKGKTQYEKERKETIELLFQEGKSGLEISRMTNYSLSSIHRILRGKKTELMEKRYKEIRKDYYNGLTKKEILEKYNISAAVFEKALPNIHEQERTLLHNKIYELHEKGYTNNEIATMLGLHRTTVTEHIYNRVSLSKKQTPYTKDLENKIINLYKNGLSQRKIALNLSIGRTNVKKAINNYQKSAIN